MNSAALLKEVRKEISRLQQIEALLQDNQSSPRGRGVGKGRGNRKPMSKAARHKISLAQKRRWEKARKEKKEAA